MVQLHLTAVRRREGGSELLAACSARYCWMMACFHRTAVCVCVYSLSAAAGIWTLFPWRQHPLVNLWRCRAQQKAQPVKCMGGMVEGGRGGGGASWTSVLHSDLLVSLVRAFKCVILRDKIQTLSLKSNTSSGFKVCSHIPAAVHMSRVGMSNMSQAPSPSTRL